MPITFRDLEGDDDVIVTPINRLPVAAQEGALLSKGYFQGTSISTAKTLAVIIGVPLPAGSTSVWIQAEAQGFRWRDDGTAPTSSTGMVLSTGDSIIYNGPLSALRFIETTSGAKLNLTFYGAA